MEKVKRNSWMVAFLIVAALMGSHVIFGDADNWEPNGPPAPTMTSLDAIYNAVSSMSPGISQREGYSKFHSCSSGATTILTVPMGRRFVLRKLWVRSGSDNYDISGGPNCNLHWIMKYISGGPDQDWMWDFPDGCVVVEGPNSLTFNNGAAENIRTIFVGYLYDIP